jgi:hypothetical protein
MMMIMTMMVGVMIITRRKNMQRLKRKRGGEKEEKEEKDEKVRGQRKRRRKRSSHRPRDCRCQEPCATHWNRPHAKGHLPHRDRIAS